MQSRVDALELDREEEALRQQEERQELVVLRHRTQELDADVRQLQQIINLTRHDVTIQQQRANQLKQQVGRAEQAQQAYRDALDAERCQLESLRCQLDQAFQEHQQDAAALVREQEAHRRTLDRLALAEKAAAAAYRPLVLPADSDEVQVMQEGEEELDSFDGAPTLSIDAADEEGEEDVCSSPDCYRI